MLTPPADGGGREARAALAVALGALAVRAGLAATTGLGVDESYAAASGGLWDWSYFDHPPAMWWLANGARAAFGESDLALRAPFLALGLLTTLATFGFARRLFGARAGLFAVVALSVMPVFSLATATWILPDGPLHFALVAAAWASARALGIGGDGGEAGRGDEGRLGDARFWPLAGLFAGTALLSKYTAVLPLAGAGAFLLIDGRGRAALRTPGPWLALAIALTAFAPVIAWNEARGWESFAFQGERGTGLSPSLVRPLVLLAGQALYVTPWLWLAAISLALRAATRRDDRAGLFLVCLAAPAILAFSLVGLWSPHRVLPHWAAPSYALLTPLVGRWAAGLAGRAARAFRSVAAASAALLALAAVVIGAGVRFGPPPGMDFLARGAWSPLAQASDWTGLRGEIAARLAPGAPFPVVAASNWSEAGKIGRALGPGAVVTVIGGSPHEFGEAHPWSGLIGADVLVLGEAADGRYASAFERFEPLAPLDIRSAGTRFGTMPAALARRLKTPPR